MRTPLWKMHLRWSTWFMVNKQLLIYIYIAVQQVLLWISYEMKEDFCCVQLILIITIFRLALKLLRDFSLFLKIKKKTLTIHHWHRDKTYSVEFTSIYHRRESLTAATAVLSNISRVIHQLSRVIHPSIYILFSCWSSSFRWAVSVANLSIVSVEAGHSDITDPTRLETQLPTSGFIAPNFLSFFHCLDFFYSWLLCSDIFGHPLKQVSHTSRLSLRGWQLNLCQVYI